jgi:hypothetical protein
MNGIKVTISPEARRLAGLNDVKHVRLSLVDRIDMFALQFPGETAFYSLALAVIVISVANLFMR